MNLVLRSATAIRHSRLDVLCKLLSGRPFAVPCRQSRPDAIASLGLAGLQNSVPHLLQPDLDDILRARTERATHPSPIQSPCSARRLSPTTLLPKS